MQPVVMLENAVNEVPVEKVGWNASVALHKAIVSREWSRAAADVLHGTWLGHPLHPVLTDITIGAWFLGGAFDVVAGLEGSAEARWAGDRLAEIGTVSAIATGLTGATDFSTYPEGTSRPVTLHAILNISALALYGVSVYDRRRGNRTRGLALSFLAQGLTAASSWLGGQLVYEHQVGVDHREDFSQLEGWHDVGAEALMDETRMKRVEVDGKAVLLAWVDGEIKAMGAVCSHAGGPLDEGKLSGNCVTCPWHDSVFDLRDGHVVHGPATMPQPPFEARVRNGRIEVRYTGPGPKP
jgi:nitrite reductase/ring-hydroxylating ferredoxin subunit/uncharacterized membrane protein